MYLPLRLRQVRTKDQMRSFTAHDMQRLNIPVGFPGFVPDKQRSHLVDNDETLMSAQCMYTCHVCIRPFTSTPISVSETTVCQKCSLVARHKKSRPYSWSRVFSCQSTVFIYNLLWRKQEYTKKNNLRQPLATELETTTLVMIELFTYYNKCLNQDFIQGR